MTAGRPSWIRRVPPLVFPLSLLHSHTGTLAFLKRESLRVWKFWTGASPRTQAPEKPARQQPITEAGYRHVAPHSHNSTYVRYTLCVCAVSRTNAYNCRPSSEQKIRSVPTTSSVAFHSPRKNGGLDWRPTFSSSTTMSAS